MSTSPEIYKLPPDPRANACGAFFDALKAGRGKAFEIDASEVERMDTLVAQVMLLGMKTWAADDVAYSVTNVSDPARTALANLGLEDVILNGRGADVD